jgi:NADPH:quinone reductase-like Zn-dependent oxidoreductase
MKVWEVVKKPGFDALVLAQKPEPKPKAGEVLVKMHAAALNYRDLLVVKDASNDSDMPESIIPLSDGAGEVVAIGSNVKDVEVGDRITSCFMPEWIEGPLTAKKQMSALGYLNDGVLAEYSVFPEKGVIRCPGHLSYEEAAALPCAALTAWNALTRRKLLPGSTVLIQGTGGVSLFALQFAKLFGARVIGLSGSAEKIIRLKELGACLTINYRTTVDWARPIMEFTGGIGVDHIIEVGGSATLSNSLSCIRYGGTISIIGQVTGATVQIDLGSILAKDVTLQGIYVGSRKMFEEMNNAITLHKLKPVVDRSFPFEQARAAMEYLESAKHFGKVCITI